MTLVVSLSSRHLSWQETGMRSQFSHLKAAAILVPDRVGRAAKAVGFGKELVLRTKVVMDHRPRRGLPHAAHVEDA